MITERIRAAWRALTSSTALTPVVSEEAPSMKISAAAEWEARRTGRPAATPDQVFAAAKPMPGVVPSGMAMDSACGSAPPIMNWAVNSPMHEGLAFLGFPYLAELAQRIEYRHAANIWAEHATRKFIKLTGPATKVKAIEDELVRLDARAVFRKASEDDGLFGRSQIFLDFDDFDDDAEIQTELMIDPRKISKKRPIKRLKTVEPMWSYPAIFGSQNPLSPEFYKPKGWYVFGRTVHTSRLLTIVDCPVPDMLKPAYAFGGQALTARMMSYVNNWLRNRQSTSDLVHSFSTMVLATEMDEVLSGGGGDNLYKRADMFNQTRDNRGLMLVNKGTEELKNVAVPLSGLDKLTAQAQEQMASAARIPLSIYLQVTPSGLNASSEGEFRSFYADVMAYQERNYRTPLHTLLQVIQLSLWGAINPKIAFEFEPLWELDEVGKAAIRKSDAEVDQIYTTIAAVDNDEVRERLRSDETSLYHGIDLSGPAPEPEEGDGDGGKDDTAKPANDEAPEVGELADIPFGDGKRGFDPAKHPRDRQGRFGSGGLVDISAHEPSVSGETYAEQALEGRGASQHHTLGVPSPQAIRAMARLGVSAHRPNGRAKAIVLDLQGVSHSRKHTAAAEEGHARRMTAADIASAHHFLNLGEVNHGVPSMTERGPRLAARATRHGYEIVAVFEVRKHVIALHDMYAERKSGK